MAERMPDQLRRRILMFYFAAGINIIMAMWAGASGVVAGGMLTAIILVFLGFAWMNFYVAKMLRKKWEAGARQRAAAAQSQNEP